MSTRCDEILKMKLLQTFSEPLCDKRRHNKSLRLTKWLKLKTFYSGIRGSDATGCGRGSACSGASLPSECNAWRGWVGGVARGQLRGRLNGKQGAMEARRKNERKQSGPSQVVMRRVSCSERREWWSELLLMDSTRTANSQQLWAHLTVGGNDTETFTRHCDPIMHHKRILNTPSDLPQASDGSITKKHKSGPICILTLNFCFPLRAVRTIIFPRMTLPW